MPQTFKHAHWGSPLYKPPLPWELLNPNKRTYFHSHVMRPRCVYHGRVMEKRAQFLDVSFTPLPGVGYALWCDCEYVCVCVCECVLGREREWERMVQISHFVKGDFTVAIVTVPCACLSLYTPQITGLADALSLTICSWTFVKIYINI